MTATTEGGAAGSEASQSARPLAPTISLPKGGGAIRGIGEKFAANPVTGTGSLTVPIATSPGRSGFGPELSLSYDSGAGNGAFGIGWNLSLPSITRKTDKGLPQYLDHEDSDVFILSGAEDLVPVLNEDLSRFADPFSVPGFTIHRYRPRIEGLFARIERWTSSDGLDCFWRSISRDNVTTWYGRTVESRIVDPEHPTRIFSWLICSSYDAKGNAIAYQYKEEDSRGVDTALVHEANRTDDTRKANTYLKRIKYGNRTPNRTPNTWKATDPATIAEMDWLFEVVFDYDDGHCVDLPLVTTAPEASQHHYITCTATESPDWPARPDPFSTYRSGFEVRSYRRCRRVLMLHNFSELSIQPCLVAATEFDYDDFDYGVPYTPDQEAAHPGSSRLGSLIRGITQSGFVHAPATGSPTRYLKRSLPPLEFEYTRATIDETVRDVKGTDNLPHGVDDSAFRWVDLDGEGLSGALTEQAGAWFYKRNVSALPADAGDGTLSVAARFEPLERVASIPVTGQLGRGSHQFLDLAGDGHVDVVELDSLTPGFFERTADGDWEAPRSFRTLPNIDWNDPNLRFLDVTGDGRADIVITEQAAFTWYRSLGEDGFAPAQRVQRKLDEELGPRLVFADSTQSIFLSDMSGDGLSDLVRIRNGEISYWPNLGYCNWGSKVAMDNAPWLDARELFDPRRIRLADIDGSGTTDVIYLGTERIDIYRNQCGNRWTTAESLTAFPATNDQTTVAAIDLLGAGTACLVWSSPLAGDAKYPMRYIDLMGGKKPHLLVGSMNNLGAETRIQYAPSTKFYLKDRAEGRPWITKLSFPVHVVERVETYDRISRSRFVTRYAYHHGYFDGEEREFRGFGMVEQQDTEEFQALVTDTTFPVGDNVDPASHVPPVFTRTWFHTGADLDGERISRALALEYFGAPAPADPNFELDWAAFESTLLPDTVLPPLLTTDERREAARALKGSTLRQETYALDGSDREQNPYLVLEQNVTLLRLQARGANQHSVFFVHPRETLTGHYERNPADPRVDHQFTLEVDPRYGGVRKALSVGYGRTPGLSPLSADDAQKQEQTLITYTESDYTNPIDDRLVYPDDYRTPLPSETRTYEVTGLQPQGMSRFQFADLEAGGFAALVGLLENPYEAPVIYTQKRKRLIEHVRTVYRGDDLASLPLHSVEPLALPGESYKLALTSGLAKQVFVDSGKVTQSQLNTILADGGGYVHSEGDGHWWLPSGRIFFSPGSTDSTTVELAEARSHFYLPRRYRDPFYLPVNWNTDSFVDYDRHDLLLKETRDALGNCVTAGERRHVLADGTVVPARDGMDYRVLQPSLVMDANRNRTEVRYDALGLLAGTAMMGKPEDTPAKGDRFDASFKPDLTAAEVAAVYGAADPRIPALNLLRDATTRIVYDVHRFRTTRLANPAAPDRWEPSFAAALARETHVSDPLPPWGLRLQISCSYTDGYGREIQRKIPAEPGPVPLRDAQGAIVVGADGRPQMSAAAAPTRWVGSGWTVFNNKGKTVRQFEPFFSDTHRPDFDVRIGVSPIMFYDPIERVVVTLHPNHCYEKVLFDPWQQTSYDVNDTAAPRNAQTGDPRTDPDIQPYVEQYFNALPVDPAGPWQTWYQQRVTGAKGPEERRAAEQTQPHTDTPSTVHLDALGRPFLTLVRNRVICDGHPLHGTENQFASRVERDIEGNQRTVRDAVVRAADLRGRVVMRYAYDMLSSRIHQISMEAGARWALSDVLGSPIHAWDSRGHHLTTAYDRLRRPVERQVHGTTIDSDPGTRGLLAPVVEKLEYGEGQPEALNLRSRLYRHSDSGGIVTTAALNPHTGVDEAYDFKGNLLRSLRQLVSDFAAIPDWSANPILDSEEFISSTRFDALNRPLQSLTHSNLAGTTVSVVQPTFNEAGLIERMQVWLGQATEPANLLNPAVDPPSPVGISNTDHNAKGQRIRIDYVTLTGEGITTTYDYSPETFRLVRLKTSRNGTGFDNTDRPGEVQDLRYVYDPSGNITYLQDGAQPTIYFSNGIIEPNSRYTYDALYRLIQATGREHLGQAGAPIPHSYNDAGRIGVLTADAAGLFAPNDQNAMARYCEKYVYDEVGNFTEMSHHPSCPMAHAWRRTYTYNEKSLIEDGNGGTLSKTSNRLSSTAVGNNALAPEPYAYDLHGNMLQMPQLSVMQWDYKDQLQMTQRQRVNSTDADGNLHQGEQTWYVCDASGSRVRKVTMFPGGGLKDERIYLGNVEIYRSHAGQSTGLRRETLHVMDDKQRIALVETRNAVDDGSPARMIRYQLGNHLGSAILELANDAQIISYEEYSPYGSSTYQAVRRATETAKRYRCTGKERDDESGLYYHGARFYAAWLGRWVSCDPSDVEKQSRHPNAYEYCTSRPTVFIDPDGRDVAVLKESRISAQALVTKIKSDESIPEQIRGAINVDPKDPSKVTFRPGLKGGRMSKADAAVWNDWGKLYKEAEVAARGQDFAFTTGKLQILPGDESKPTSVATADVPSGSIGMGTGKTFVGYKSNLIDVSKPDQGTVGITLPSERQQNQLKAEKREQSATVVTNRLANERGLIVVIDQIVTAKGEPLPMSDREIVHTFFHELALHAGGIAQEKVGIAHGTPRVDELKSLVDKLLPQTFQREAEPTPSEPKRQLVPSGPSPRQ
jgi:RHS repeat-associated protein